MTHYLRTPALRILSPEVCKKLLTVTGEMLKSREVRAGISKLNTKTNKSQHKLRQVKTRK